MQGVGHIGGQIVHFRAAPPIDVKIRALAERQHGVVALPQLRRLGLSKDAAAKRVRAGRLTRIHRGVYAVGHGRLTAKGRVMAAVLAYGPGALASHRTAAWLRELRPDNRAVVDVTVPGRSARRRTGIRLHRTVTLRHEDRAEVDGIPCTSVSRTLVDLAGELDRRGLERVIHEAEVRDLFDLGTVEAACARAHGHPGAAALQEVLRDLRAPGMTDRELEERFLRLCREAGFPKPEVNVWLDLGQEAARAGFMHAKVDFLWRREGLVIETDSWRFHRTRRAFERDRERDQWLRLAGFEPVRVTWRQIEADPAGVLGRVSRLLGQVGGRSSRKARSSASRVA
jgi:hypothetical protein